MALHAAACTSHADDGCLSSDLYLIYNPDLDADECSINHSKQQIQRSGAALLASRGDSDCRVYAGCNGIHRSGAVGEHVMTRTSGRYIARKQVNFRCTLNHARPTAMPRPGSCIPSGPRQVANPAFNVRSCNATACCRNACLLLFRRYGSVIFTPKRKISPTRSSLSLVASRQSRGAFVVHAPSGECCRYTWHGPVSCCSDQFYVPRAQQHRQ